ncbi:MAG: cobalt-precorrin-3B C(17)-methyltransferase [Methanobrevibacter sp.]|jgi:precorrin-3B C17-methyltransferase|nr:cobalt-precorrin-3B C(17)-methyltransferase [Candidatus Methanovirga aequatorialis]
MLHIIRVDSNRENMTIGALNALKKSEVVVGYEEDLNKIEDLIEGKIVPEEIVKDGVNLIDLGISMALNGDVALVDREDPETFGLANLFFQNLGKYDEFEFKIYPSTTSINYGASLLGAPLTDFVAIDLSSNLIPLSEIKEKIENGAKSNFVIVVYKGKKYFKLIKKILLDLKKEDVLVGVVNDMDYYIVKLENLNDDELSLDTILIVGNRTTYAENNKLITPQGVLIAPYLHPLTKEFYANFINDKSPKGPDKTCEYYPCHDDMENQQCDFCYCPFYPCGDGSTGGKWIKNKNVWNCVDCSWIHERNVVNCVKPKLKEIFTDVEDLKTKKEDLLKIRRECIFKTGS